MSKINWSDSRSTWRARPAHPARELFAQSPGKSEGATRTGYLTLALAFSAVAVGSAGATLVAMSVMSADVPEPANSAADVAIAETVPVEPAPGVASVEKNAPEVQTAVWSGATVAQPSAVEQVAAQAPKIDPEGQGADVAVLHSSDPRWAQFEKPAPPLEELRNEAQAFGSAGRSGGALAAVKRAIQEPEEELAPDSQETAAITPPRALEAETKADAGGKQIVLSTAANLRSRANKSGKVLGAVPARVRVTSHGCRSSWCEVSYKGLRGWVYSGFVAGNGGKSNSSGQKSRPAQAASARQKLQVTPSSAAKANGALPGVRTNEPLPAVPRIDKSGK